MKKKLQLLGLNKNEALVYEVLVKHGPCKAGLVIRKLDINRNLVYRALESLVLNGYVTRVEKRGVWYFQISDPRSLLTSMRRKERMFTEVLKEIELYQNQANRQIVVYEGKESYGNYWVRSLERIPAGTIDYVAGGEVKQWSEFIGKKKTKRYWELATEKKITWKSLYFGISPTEIGLLKQLPISIECREWKKPSKKFLGNFNVIHDTVILHTMFDPPRIIEIRDQLLATMFQNYFDMMWEQARQVKLS